MKKSISKAKSDIKIKAVLLDAICFIFGSFLVSVSVNMFTAPNEIAPGGATGIATLINHEFGFPIGAVILVINIPLFLIGWRFLGGKFLIKTIIVTVMNSFAIDALAPYITPYGGDRLLAALFGGVLSGFGFGLVFLRGATSGGTDIIGQLLKLRLPHVALGTLVLFLDMAVVAAAGYVYKSIESILYAVIVFFISSRVINYLLYGSGNGKLIMAVTTKPDEISSAITREVRRGVSILPVKGGYTGEDKSMIMSVIRPAEMSKINRVIRKIDPNAFVIISEAEEIMGLGFKNINQ